MQDLESLTARLEQERSARLEAESRLESTTRELRAKNQELDELARTMHRAVSRGETILRAVPYGVVTFDRQGNIRFANPAAQTMLGARDAAGRNLAEFFPALAEAGALAGLAGAPGGPVTREVLAQLDGDGTVPFELAVEFVESGEEAIFVSVLRDLRDCKRMERQLIHSHKMKSVGQLAAGMAHEINTPIQFVGDNLRFLQRAFNDVFALLAVYQHNGHGGSHAGRTSRERPLPAELSFVLEEVPAAIEQSVEGIARVAEIVRALKTFSSTGSGGKQRTDLSKAIQSTLAASRNVWKDVADVVTDLDPGLTHVTCFPAELNQVILNLLLNAADAVREAGRDRDEAWIRITTRRRSGVAEIRVSDNGKGIPETMHDRIFEPFYTTKPVGAGTGQGLSVCYSVIVERHGGTISVEGEPGEGATFVVQLPHMDSTVEEALPCP